MAIIKGVEKRNPLYFKIILLRTRQSAGIYPSPDSQIKIFGQLAHHTLIPLIQLNCGIVLRQLVKFIDGMRGYVHVFLPELFSQKASAASFFVL